MLYSWVREPPTAVLGGKMAKIEVLISEIPDTALRDRINIWDWSAPAAVLASGEAKPADSGPAADVHSLVPLLLPLAEVEEGRVTGQVLWGNGFGNVQTNLAPECRPKMTCYTPGCENHRLPSLEARWPRSKT